MIYRGACKSKFIIKPGETGLNPAGASSAFLGYKLHSQNYAGNDGIWASWEWKNNRFEFKNDRYGFLPLYYFNTGNSFGISSSITDLLQNGASNTLDDAAIAFYLRKGFYLGDHTPFKAIRAVPPGCKLTWSHQEKLHIKTNGVPFKYKTNNISRKAAVKAYGELFQSAIEKMLPEERDKVCVPLSGGRDSRHILFALDRADYKPDVSITMMHPPPISNEDAEIASQVAKHLHVPHLILQQSDMLVAAELQKNILTNFCSKEHIWILPLADYVQKNNFTIIYDGLCGDILSQSSNFNEERLNMFEAGKMEQLAIDILGVEGYLPKILPSYLYKRWNRDIAIAHLIHELEKHTNAANPVAQFFFWNRSRREIALSPWSILADPVCVLAPYLNYEVYDFLTQLPVSYFIEPTFHTEAINCFYKEYAHLPFERRDKPPNRNNFFNICKQVKDISAFLLSPKKELSFVRRSFLPLRLTKALINNWYGTQILSTCRAALYLAQLEKLVNNPHDSNFIPTTTLSN